jgi:uncharacterized protein (TIRG00374 family)
MLTTKPHENGGAGAEVTPQRKSRLLAAMLRLIVAVGLIAILFTKVPLAQVLKTLAEANLLFCAAGYFLIVLVNVAAAAQLMIAVGLHKMPFGFGQLLRLQFIASFYSAVIPSEITTSVIKWSRLSRGKRFRAQSAAIVIACRVVNWATLFALGLGAAFFDDKLQTPALRLLLIVAFVATVVAALPLVSRRTANLMGLWGVAVSSRIVLPSGLRSALGKVWHATTAFSSMERRRSALLLLTALMQHALGAWAYWLLFRAVGVELAIASILWLRVTIFIINALPISFNGLGVREAALTSILPAFYGIAPVAALAASLTLVGRQVVLFMIGGSCELYETLVRREPTVEDSADELYQGGKAPEQ